MSLLVCLAIISKPPVLGEAGLHLVPKFIRFRNFVDLFVGSIHPKQVQLTSISLKVGNLGVIKKIRKNILLYIGSQIQYAYLGWANLQWQYTVRSKKKLCFFLKGSRGLKKLNIYNNISCTQYILYLVYQLIKI